jgi:hypothetical protein
MRQFKTQLCSSLWTCDLHCVEHFNFMKVVHMNVNTFNTSMMIEHVLLITNIECKIGKQLKFASFSCATQMKGNCPHWWCSQITMNSKKTKSSYLQKMSTNNQYISASTNFIASRKSQIKTAHIWVYLINVCTTSSIGRMHGRIKINSKSHNKSKFSTTSFFFNASIYILTTNDLY